MPQKTKAADSPAAFKAVMPVFVDRIGDKHVLVLRGSGANMVLIRRSLVRDEELAGEASAVKLTDSAVRHLPEARIRVSTPY